MWDDSNTIFLLEIKDKGISDKELFETNLITYPERIEGKITLNITRSDLINNKWVYVGVYFPGGIRANGKTSISFKSNDQEKVRVRNLRAYCASYKYLHAEEENNHKFWKRYREQIEEIGEIFEDINCGFLIDEPWRPTWELMTEMKDSVEHWQSVDKSTTRSDMAPVLALNNVGEDHISHFIKIFEPEVYFYDFYTLGWNSWSESHDSVSNGKTVYKSIQKCWDQQVYCEYSPDIKKETVDYWKGIGLKSTAEKCREAGIDFWYCMQTFGSFRKEGKKIKGKMREPTREEILCQGYLGLTYGAKGFSYYHYSPMYTAKTDTPLVWWDFANFGEDDRVRTYADSMRGAFTRGMVDIWKKTEDPFVDSQLELYSAMQKYGGGFLAPNYKYYAVQEFNHLLHTYDEFLSGLNWEYSECTNSENYGEIAWVTIDYSENEYGIPDDFDYVMDSTFIEVGIFEGLGDTRIFSLVNRRVSLDETRIIGGHIITDGYRVKKLHDVFEDEEIDTKETWDGNYSFEVEIPPGEGKFIRALIE